MAANPKRQRKVLILEDEPFIAIMLEEELAAMGIHVIGPVNNLKSAIHLAETPDLDGALLDLNINGAYATDVADKLRLRATRSLSSPAMSRQPACAIARCRCCVSRSPRSSCARRCCLCGTDSDSRRDRRRR